MRISAGAELPTTEKNNNYQEVAVIAEAALLLRRVEDASVSHEERAVRS
jgi:hypothetical protein